MARNRKDHLIEAALGLFQHNSFHATGIDKILDEAGVAKMTLYHHFKSKDELILAALQQRDEQFREQLLSQVHKRARSPKRRLLAMFEILEEQVGQAEFRGCSFIKAAAEFAEPENPIHTACATHKRLVIADLHELAEEAGARDPERLANELMLLWQGALVLAQITGDSRWARQAREAAQMLLDNTHLEDPKPTRSKSARRAPPDGASETPVETSQPERRHWAAWRKK